MDITTKIDMLLREGNWSTDSGVTSRLMDKNVQVQVFWKPGQKEVKVQFSKLDNPSEYIGHAMVATKGMKSKDFLKHVDSDIKKIWKSKKKGMKESVNEDVYDAEAIVGKKKITKPMSAKSDKDAEAQFRKFLEMQMKRGHIDKGEIKSIKVKKA